MNIMLLTASIIALIMGVFGCIIPALPGPPLSYLAIILLQYCLYPAPFSTQFLISLGVITSVVFILDYVAPILGVKFYGASKNSIWGAVIGMIAGLFFFPPFGIVLGMLIGAVVGEIIAGKGYSQAMLVGLLTLSINLIFFFLKFTLSVIMVFYFVKALVEA